MNNIFNSEGGNDDNFEEILDIKNNSECPQIKPLDKKQTIKYFEENDEYFIFLTDKEYR